MTRRSPAPASPPCSTRSASANASSACARPMLEILVGMAQFDPRGQREGVLRAEHLLHLRCEISHPDTASLFAEFIGDPGLRLVSIMDHTPGQRQFTTIERYYEYYHEASTAGRTPRWRPSSSSRPKPRPPLRRQQSARPWRRWARARGLPQASHDDGTAAHVDESIELGMTIAEFPTTEEAATLAHRHGMAVVMGAPNVVRGGSHSGNISARGQAALGQLDILSSDYAPVSLLHAAFLLSSPGRGRASACRSPSRRSRATPSAQAPRRNSTTACRIAPPANAADLVRVRGWSTTCPLVRGRSGAPATASRSAHFYVGRRDIGPRLPRA